MKNNKFDSTVTIHIFNDFLYYVSILLACGFAMLLFEQRKKKTTAQKYVYESERERERN